MTDTILSDTSGADAASSTPETNTPAGNWRDGLSDDYKDKFTEFKDINSVFKGYDSLVSKMGKNPIVKPKEGASEQELKEYNTMLRKELGAPEDVSAYDFKLSEDLPEGFIDDKQLGAMKEVFLEEGIPADAAQRIIDKYLDGQVEAYNEFNNSAENAKEEAITTLKDQWKDEYDGNVNKAIAFADKYAPPEVVEKFGNDPDFIKYTLSLHQLTSENRIDNEGMQVKSTPAEMRAEAVSLMRSDDYKNPMSPNHNTIRERVSGIYKRIAEAG
jgi:hypothetical protein